MKSSGVAGSSVNPSHQGPTPIALANSGVGKAARLGETGGVFIGTTRATLMAVSISNFLYRITQMTAVEGNERSSWHYWRITTTTATT